MDVLLAVILALILVVLLIVLSQLLSIKKKLGPNDGGDKPPLPTSHSDTDNTPNDSNPDPPLPT